MASVEATDKATNLQLCLYLSNIVHKIFDDASEEAICKVCQFGRLTLLDNKWLLQIQMQNKFIGPVYHMETH